MLKEVARPQAIDSIQAAIWNFDIYIPKVIAKLVWEPCRRQSGDLLIDGFVRDMVLDAVTGLPVEIGSSSSALSGLLKFIQYGLATYVVLKNHSFDENFRSNNSLELLQLCSLMSSFQSLANRGGHISHYIAIESRYGFSVKQRVKFTPND